MPRLPGSKDTRPRKRRCDKLDDAEKVLHAQRSARQSKIKKREERGAERRAALGCASLFDMVRFVPALALVQTCDSHLLQGLVNNGPTGATTSRPPESSSASAASGTPLVSSSAQGCSDDSHHEMRGTEDSMSSDDDAPGLVDSDSDDEASNVTAMDVSSAMQAHTAFDDRLTRGAEAQENLRGTQDGDAATRFRERLARFQELLKEAKAKVAELRQRQNELGEESLTDAPRLSAYPTSFQSLSVLEPCYRELHSEAIALDKEIVRLNKEIDRQKRAARAREEEEANSAEVEEDNGQSVGDDDPVVCPLVRCFATDVLSVGSALWQ
jgi:hypothetical protein